MKKLLAFAITALFVGASVVPLTGMEEKSTIGRAILYVGGSGPGNYSKIQDAIDNASNGDIVYVYNGTYYEDVIILDIPVDLIGEDRNTTIVYGTGSGDTVRITGDRVNISGFTLQNAVFGIKVFSQYIIITDNIVTNNDIGIFLSESCSDVIVEGNEIVNNNLVLNGGYGIQIFGSNISIKGNLIGWHDIPGTLLTAGIGIHLHIMDPENGNVNISWNAITENLYGLIASIYTNSNVSFYMNDITNNTFGMEIWVQEPPNSTTLSVRKEKAIIFKQNNFRRNRLNVLRKFSNFNLNMLWEKNYWGRTRFLPKVIVVFRMLTKDFGIPSRLEIDWRPALDPYDI